MILGPQKVQRLFLNSLYLYWLPELSFVLRFLQKGLSQATILPSSSLTLPRVSGGVAAFVRSSTIGPLNNRTNKRNKERGVKTIELL